jgi:acyl-coenzyme A synthetase/AMP-(fatty) acid ligase
MPQTVAELLDHASRRFGDQPFLCIGALLCIGDRRATFATFVQAVRRAANLLLAKGLQPGDRVAILLPRSEHEAVFLLAAMLAHGVAVPIHGKLKDDQIRHVLTDAEPRFVITNAARTVGLRDPEAVLRGFEVLDVDLQAGSWSAGQCNVDQCNVDQCNVDQVPADQRSCELVAQRSVGNAPDPAVLLYTSGSTGRAKGIVQTQQNLLRGARCVSDYLHLVSHDHLLVLLSFSFDYGLNQLLTALLVGCRLTAADHLGVGELAALLEQHQPTGLAGVPSLWHEVAVGLQTGALTERHGRSLRYVTNSGGSLRVADSEWIRAHWPHVAVFAMYGLTEAFRSAFLPPDELHVAPDSFGYAIAGVELLLVSTTDGSVLSGPATGELVHAGALIASGYWRRPEDQARRFRPDPRDGHTGTVVYSGDLVRRDEQGRHYFVARMDRMLKVNGHRVSPDEVAQAIVGMEGVGEVCVFGVPGGADGHRIVLCLAGDADDRTLLDSVRRRCRSRLPSYMVPAEVHVLSRLPHNANGKIDEAALRALRSESV